MADNKKVLRKGRRIFLRRFLRNPGRVAYLVPSSPMLVNDVVGEMDLTKPRIIAEFGPGEGCHTREILKRAHPETRIILFELDRELADFLKDLFEDEPRVQVLHRNCCEILDVMSELEIEEFDYIFSGIPFSLMDKPTKQSLMRDVYKALKPGSRFVIYQVTNELARYGSHFDELKTKRCLLNLPPMVVTSYLKNGISSLPEETAAG